MSVAYEARSFLHEGTYPPIGDEPDHAADQRFTDSEVAEHLSHYAAEAAILPDDRGVMGDDRDMLVEDDAQLDLDVAGFSSPLHVPLHVPMPDAVSDVKLTPGPGSGPDVVAAVAVAASPHPSRVKPIPKPDREVKKDSDGKFHCSLHGCREEIRAFTRKCEWNKHMDKHERPYRCAADGCENLPGFTYSGGLLRHEREVHGKHGGPKKTVNCPHPTCKRHTGKGFSRQENLNEHLRRVHTHPDAATPPFDGPASPPGGPVAAPVSAPGPASAADDDDGSSSQLSGAKRKREPSSHPDELTELREEIKRVREENDKLKQQSLTMMAQLTQLQEMLRHGLAPTAHMI